MDLTLIHLDAPTETRTFEKGRFDVYRIGPMTLGRATYVSLHIMGSEDYTTT
jgi:hypothetical protein